MVNVASKWGVHPDQMRVPKHGATIGGGWLVWVVKRFTGCGTKGIKVY